ncbi:MAG: DUF4115 domain-containing protein [Gallionella sp.]|nr:DUF4115 domain-containing protein [Gallionella sp.]MDD4958674.1 DUF4115 domain-containing protein [Gallionella sp.]
MVIEDNLPAQSKSPIKLGQTLRVAREQQGLSLKDIAESIKLPVQRLMALEDEDYAQLPDMTFVRGFVRSYGKLLGLDVPSLLAALPAPKSTEIIMPATSEVPLASQRSTRRKQNSIWLAAAAGVVLVASLFAVWSFNTPPNASVSKLQDQALEQGDFSVIPLEISTVASAPNPISAVLTTLPTSGVVLAAAPLRLVFDEDAWVEVKEQSGKVLSSQLNYKGGELRLDGRPPFSLVIGNSPSVHLYYKGAEIDLSEHISRSDSAIARLELE